MYIPKPAVIKEIINENNLVKTFRLTLSTDGDKPQPFRFEAGQFVMLSVPHCGEAPISISSNPANPTSFDLTIRKAGQLTSAIQDMVVGEEVGIRGPFGHPFPVDDLLGKRLLLVAGGIGLAPLKGALESCLSWKKVKKLDQLNLTLCYGSRSPEDICFQADTKKWHAAGVQCQLTVDKGDQNWQGEIGLVTNLLAQQSYTGDGYALVCGPPIMIRATIAKLQDLDWPSERILTTLERHMKCGVGVCGHCHLDDKMVCSDGPVFSLAQLMDMRVVELN